MAVYTNHPIKMKKSNLATPPETEIESSKYTKKKYCAICMFVLGFLCSRISLNVKYPRLRIELPASKLEYLRLLQSSVGGSISMKVNKASVTHCLEIKKRDDLLNLLDLVLKVRRKHPEVLEDYELFLRQFLGKPRRRTS